MGDFMFGIGEVYCIVDGKQHKIGALKEVKIDFSPADTTDWEQRRKDRFGSKVDFGSLAGRYVWEILKDKINRRWRQCKKAQAIHHHPKVIDIKVDFSGIKELYGYGSKSIEC